MSKIWKNNRRDIRDLKSRLREGDTVYTVRKISPHVAPYEDAQLYAAHEFTWHSPITGNLMTGHLSIEGLLAQEGEIHEKPPAGIRNIVGPGRQYAAPTSQQALDRLRRGDRAKAGSRR